MTDYPIVRFVSGLSSDASTRFDFHELGVSSTDPAAWVWTPGGLLGDPDSINPDYGFGRLDFELQVHTSHADAVRIMAALARELRRSSNFLLFEFDAYTPPAWLEVFPSSPGALGFPYAKPGTDDSVWVIPVSLTTGATWIGEQVTHEVSVAHGPTYSNGLRAVLPDIQGDAPAELIVDIPGETAGLSPFLSVAAYDETPPALQFWEAESWTGGSNVTDADFSGGTYKALTNSGTMSTRLTGDVTTTTAGRFLLFARYVASIAGTDTFAVEGGGGALMQANRSALDVSHDGRGMLLLGEYTFPAHNRPLSRTYTLTAEAGAVTVRTSRDGSTATLGIDYIIAVPVDGIDLVAPARSMTLDAPPLSLNDAEHVYLNGEQEAFEAVFFGGAHGPVAAQALVGAFPVVTPGATNVLHFFPRGRQSGGLVGGSTLTLSYRPRHVYLPGS